MRSGRAGRLLRRAARSGFRGRAWERLLAAGADGDQAVVDALWAAWFDGDPREEPLDVLMSWGRPMSGPRNRLSRTLLEDDAALSGERRSLLIEIALVSDHPMGAIARDRIARTSEPALLREAVRTALGVAGGGRPLEEMLADRDDLPGDPVLLAELFLVTGRLGRYRALDPDGSLLATAYEGAGAERRERMRAAMLRAGDLDVVRVVAARDRVADLDVGQRRDLAHGLLDARQWDQAWRMARRLPLADAARVVRSLPDGWRPGGAGDALCARLRAAPENLREMVDVLEASALRVLHTPHVVAAGAFSPGGRYLAAVCRDPIDGGRPQVLLVADLHDGASRLRAVHRTEFTGGRPSLVMTERGIALRPYPEGDVHWLAYADPVRSRLPLDPPVLHLGRVPGGLVVVDAADGGALRVRRLDEDGRPVPGGPLTAAELPCLAEPAAGGGRRTWIDEMVTDPSSGRIAFHGLHPSRYVIIEPDGRVVADSRRGPGPLPGAGTPFPGTCCFTAPDRLFGDRRILAATADGRLRETAVAAGGVPDLDGAVHLPGRNELLVTSLEPRPGLGDARFLDAETLAPVLEKRSFAGVSITAAWSSPAGGLYGVGRSLMACVVDEPARVLADLAGRRPLGELTAADLRVLTELRPLAETRAGGAPHRPVAAVLHDVLAASPVGTDVEIGAADAPAGRPDDIALGDPPA